MCMFDVLFECVGLSELQSYRGYRTVPSAKVRASR